MLNLIMFAIGAFNCHAVFAFIGMNRERQVLTKLIYAVAIICVAFFLFMPESFLLPSVPKMYFPNYYNPGAFNVLRVIFLDGICVPLVLYELLKAYRGATLKIRQNQLKYFALALAVGYSIGFLPNFLVYDINVDPLWGMLFAIIFAVPLVYGAVKYELFDVKIIAKQAFLYSIAVALFGGFIATVVYISRMIEGIDPTFPLWSLPLGIAVMAVTGGIFVWRKLREGELLKYEFITTVTHKFRTPLTHIKWAAENLSKLSLPEDGATQLSYIESADAKLVDLTDILINASGAENDIYEYHLRLSDISALAKDTIDSLASRILSQGLSVITDIDPGIRAKCDAPRIRFVMQTFMENAIHYTKSDGRIAVGVHKVGKEAVFTVKDTGVGIAREELPYVFSKFYRGREARLIDTEGIGIGLYTSKGIVDRHRGRVWVESEGAGKGSLFAFALPAVE